MEEQYNWKLILSVSVPLSLLIAYIFYSGLGDKWKASALVASVVLAGFIVYMKERKKSSVFTAAAIVLLAALIIRFGKNFGFF